VNPEQWLKNVERAIENRVRGKTAFFHIGWGAGGIACRPRLGEPPPDPIFGTFGDQELERGLSCRQWDELKKKIAEFLEW